MIFMYQQGGKIGHSTSFSSHLLPRVHGVLGATFSGRRVGGTIQSGVKLNISIWFSEIVTRSVGFWHTSTTACLETEVLSAQVSGMFSNRPYLPIHFQVLVVLYTSSTCFQDLSGSFRMWFWHWKCFLLTQEAASHGRSEMPIKTVPHAHHLFENQRARLVWIRVQVEIRITYIYGHPYIYILYTYITVFSYNILLCIDILIYIYFLYIIYLHDTRSRRKTLELPDSPWHPNSSPKADHRKPCRALMSRIFRWGPYSHWEPQSLWRRQILCFLSVFPMPIPHRV